MNLAAELIGRDWELMWAPYDESTYRTVLQWIRSDDVVLEIGAGDFRLARRISLWARKCYAIEIDFDLAAGALGGPLPDNLTVIHADAYTHPFPDEITLAVLLMRHCRHFSTIAEKLRAIGCRRLVTNVRRHESVELIDLMGRRRPYSQLLMGWYACWCGAVGFVPGLGDALTADLERIVNEVHSCPECPESSVSNYYRAK